ncbi:hypothetical protein LSH36_186g01011 [Paralvinella palmiformis]|uniref:VWFA domain-containing protein n=1 Tax=Paralvinella palmiformis TaxID=53620 RepID=A0AAD9JSC1_9ANNE|nr:hypothetical protein LSH36_186g01011 [Paralvinella palmiformis]
MKRAIGATVQLLGGTRTDLALERMRQIYEAEERRGAPKLAIVITDGESTYTDMTAYQAKLARQHGVTVFAVGVGHSVNEKELARIASSPEYVFEVDTFEALKTIRELLTIKACSLEQADSPPVTPPTKGCDGKPADVVFALDASSSIWQLDFTKQLSFVEDVVSIFEISDNATRVGVLTYADRVRRHFHLHKHTDGAELRAAIGEIEQSGGNTNTAAAIRAIRKHYFAPRRSRPDVVHIGIVITDGRSDNPKETARQARMARKEGIHLFAVGVGKHVDQRELYNIASQPPEEYVFEVNNYEALGSVKQLLAMKTCEVTEPPTTPKPTTTTTTPPIVVCSPQLPADIVFAMPPDVTSAQSGHVLGLIRNLTTVLDLEGSGVRLGLAPKPCHVVPGFSLGEGSTNKEEVISKMTSFPVKRADPGEVIKHIRDVSFQESHGARHTSRKIGVAFVDTAGGRGDLILAASEMPRMQNDGIELLVVGVGDKVSRTELNSLIAPDMDRNVMISSSWEHLNDLSDQMKRRFDDLCAEYLLKAHKQ